MNAIPSVLLSLLILSGAMGAGTDSTAPGDAVTVGDARIEVTLRLGSGRLTEAAYRTGGVQLAGVTGVPWVLEFGGNALTPAGSSIRLLPNASPHRADFRGENPDFVWALSYEVTGPGGSPNRSA